MRFWLAKGGRERGMLPGPPLGWCIRPRIRRLRGPPDPATRRALVARPATREQPAHRKAGSRTPRSRILLGAVGTARGRPQRGAIDRRLDRRTGAIRVRWAQLAKGPGHVRKNRPALGRGACGGFFHRPPRGDPCGMMLRQHRSDQRPDRPRSMPAPSKKEIGPFLSGPGGPGLCLEIPGVDAGV